MNLVKKKKGVRKTDTIKVYAKQQEWNSNLFFFACLKSIKIIGFTMRKTQILKNRFKFKFNKWLKILKLSSCVLLSISDNWTHQIMLSTSLTKTYTFRNYFIFTEKTRTCSNTSKAVSRGLVTYFILTVFTTRRVTERSIQVRSTFWNKQEMKKR